jgi:hypothetical protein
MNEEIRTKQRKSYLIAHSEAKELQQQIAEWHPTGHTIHTSPQSYGCQWCGSHPANPQHELYNDKTDTVALVCDLCLDWINYVCYPFMHNSSKSELTEQRWSFLQPLLTLMRSDDQECTHDVAKDLIMFGAVLPRDMLYLLEQLDKHAIRHDPSAYSVVVNFDGDMQELFDLSDVECSQVWSCLSEPQQTSYLSYHGIEADADECEVGAAGDDIA